MKRFIEWSVSHTRRPIRKSNIQQVYCLLLLPTPLLAAFYHLSSEAMQLTGGGASWAALLFVSYAPDCPAEAEVSGGGQHDKKTQSEVSCCTGLLVLTRTRKSSSSPSN